MKYCLSKMFCLHGFNNIILIFNDGKKINNASKEILYWKYSKKENIKKYKIYYKIEKYNYCFFSFWYFIYNSLHEKIHVNYVYDVHKHHIDNL